MSTAHWIYRAYDKSHSDLALERRVGEDTLMLTVADCCEQVRIDLDAEQWRRMYLAGQRMLQGDPPLTKILYRHHAGENLQVEDMGETVAFTTWDYAMAAEARLRRPAVEELHRALGEYLARTMPPTEAGGEGA